MCIEKTKVQYIERVLFLYTLEKTCTCTLKLTVKYDTRSGLELWKTFLKIWQKRNFDF